MTITKKIKGMFSYELKYKENNVAKLNVNYKTNQRPKISILSRLVYNPTKQDNS